MGMFFAFSCFIDKNILKKGDILLNSLRHYDCVSYEGKIWDLTLDGKMLDTLCEYKATQVIGKNYKNVLKSI